MYQLMLIFTLVVFASVAETARADDDCPSASEYYTGRDCCEITNILYPFWRSDNVRKCSNKYFGNSTQSPSTKTPMVCAMECIFFEEGLLTDDISLNKTAIMELYTPSDLAVTPDTLSDTLLMDVVDKCFLSYQSDVDSISSLECKSGAFRFQRCFTRETFINCPASLWTASSECDEIKAKVTKCPRVIVS